MIGAAPPLGRVFHAIVWNREEVELLFEAEAKVPLIEEKLRQLFQTIMHSFLMVAKYPRITLTEDRFRPIAPFNKSMQSTIDLAKTEERRLLNILENLISFRPLPENRRMFELMIAPERFGGSLESYFTLYVLFQTIYSFVEKHMDVLRQPFYNRAILDFVSTSIPVEGKLLSEEHVKGQLRNLKEYMAKLEPLLAPENLQECIVQIRARSLLLSPLEKIVYTITTTLQKSHERDFHEKMMKEWIKGVDQNKTLKEITDRFFRSPVEGRFKIAQEIVNTDAIDLLPGHIRMIVWRCLAENDVRSKYLGFMKNQALHIAEGIRGSL